MTAKLTRAERYDPARLNHLEKLSEALNKLPDELVEVFPACNGCSQLMSWFWLKQIATLLGEVSTKLDTLKR